MPQLKTVVVVGAGIAGLAACKTLIDQGITDIVLLEGQDHAGGRIRSVAMSNGGGWAELGAQWIHGEDNAVHAIASSRHLVSDHVSAEGLGKYVYLDGEEIAQKVVHEVEGVVGYILEECEKFCCHDNDAAVDYDNDVDLTSPLSVGHYLCDKFRKYLDECRDPPQLYQTKMDLFDWHIRFQVIDNSCDNLNELSAKFWGCYKFSGGRDYVNFKNGYSTLIESLVEDLPADLLKLNSAVTKIIVDEQNSDSDNSDIRTSRPVTVVCENNVQYRTSHVIVTSSLGYLKRNHQTLFSPSLPHSLVKAIETMGFNAINKIFLIYEEPWWSKEDKGFQVMWRGKQHTSLNHKEYWMKSLTGFDVLSNFDNVLLGWVGGKGAIEMEELTVEEISGHCTNLLAKITRRHDLPLPTEVIRSQWHRNRFVCGGYSHTTSRCDQACGPESLQIPVYVESALSSQHPAILLAGEATHEKYFSTTHGAYESGERQANRIISFMNTAKKL